MPELNKTTLKSFIRKAAKGCCDYCKAQECISPTPFSFEHIVPLSKKGSGEFRNLALVCQACNNFKFILTHAIDPMTGELVPLFHPREMSWEEHFCWSADFLRIIGITPAGRATVQRLKLNRPCLINQREMLVQVGRHPIV